MSGQGAGGNSFVKFTRTAATRIAKAVRIVEGGNRTQGGVEFEHPLAYSPRVFRVATFTGTWSKGTSNTVTFLSTTSTPNTAVAQNIFVTVGSTATGTRNCAIARDGTAWYLISAEC